MKKTVKKGHRAGSRKRYLALLMSLCLIAGMMPITARAEESSKTAGLCEHHTEHTSECGYAEVVEGQACGHIHDESCGYQEAGACTHIHTEECGEDGESCTHVHDADCGYAEGQECTHVHDEACGYTEGTEGSSCTNVCEICAEKAKQESGAEGSRLGEAALAVQELIDALPDAEDITEENLDEVSEQLDEIDEAKGKLTDEEREALDFTRYDAAAAKITELLGEEGAGVPEALGLDNFDMTGQPTGATVRTINLNAAVLRPTDANGKKWDAANGNKVYFGKYNGNPTAYRVLSSPNTQTGVENCLLLDCDTVLKKMAFDEDGNKNDGQTQNPNEWAGSDLEAWLNKEVNGTYNFYGNPFVFSDIEKNAIVNTTLLEQGKSTTGNDNYGYIDDLATDYVFCLSMAEAEGGYKDNDARIKSDWWLRSADPDPDSDGYYYVGCIPSSGKCNYTSWVEDNAAGVSPALNVNLSSVLLASESGMSKAGTGMDLTTVSAGTSKKWKLTLLDNDKTVRVPTGEDITTTDKGGSTVVTVPYTYTDSNTANAVTQISVMITDKAYTDSSAQVLYYGALQGVTISDLSGTGTFTLPSDFKAKIARTGCYVYILAEDVNGNTETDYASAPVEIMKFDPIPSAPTGGTGTDNGAGEGTFTETDSTETPDVSGNPNVTYRIVEGADSNWTAGSSEGLTVKGSGALGKFIGVKVDGVRIDAAHYTVAEDIAMVTLKASYLATLEQGTHTLELIWTDGSATTTFTVSAPATLKKDDVPKTGETTPLAWLLTLALLSGTGLLLSGRKRRNGV